MVVEKIHPEDRQGDQKGQSNLREPNHTGMIQEEEQVREDPSAVTNLTLESEAEGGEGKTDTEAPDSTRNLLEERRS